MYSKRQKLLIAAAAVAVMTAVGQCSAKVATGAKHDLTDQQISRAANCRQKTNKYGAELIQNEVNFRERACVTGIRLQIHLFEDAAWAGDARTQNEISFTLPTLIQNYLDEQAALIEKER